MTGHTAGRSLFGTRLLPLVAAAATVPALLSLPAADAATKASARSALAGELSSSTYLGGLEWDEAGGVTTDGDGNIILTGFTLSDDFPVVGAASRGHDAIVDAFVTKLTADSSRIRWSTQLGGLDMDAANAVTTDTAGNVYVTGRTGSRDFPVRRALQRRIAGRACTGEPCHDAFVAKLSPSGRLRWATYFGGTGSEEPFGIALDRQGDVYIAGATDSTDLPLRGPFQRNFQSSCPGDLPCPYDGFVTKLAANGQTVLYSTYLGGKDGDIARAITVDRRGRAYVTGSTGSQDFPTENALQGGMRGRHCGPPPNVPCRQAFVTKLNRAGSELSYSTYLGGTEHDDGFAIAVDGRNRAYVTGSTASPDFPTRNAVQGSLDNAACTSTEPEELCDDAFVAKLRTSGRRLHYSTYLGGQAEDQGLTIDVAPGGRALVGGRTDSTDFPVTAGVAQSAFGGVIDGFGVELRRRGGLSWSTFLGGADADRVTGITAAAGGGAHLVGRTLSTNFPTLAPIQPALHDDDYDAFVTTLR